MQQKLLQNCFATRSEARAFGNKIGKEQQKPHSKLKNMGIIYLLRIFAPPAILCKW